MGIVSTANNMRAVKKLKNFISLITNRFACVMERFLSGMTPKTHPFDTIWHRDCLIEECKTLKATKQRKEQIMGRRETGFIEDFFNCLFGTGTSVKRTTDFWGNPKTIVHNYKTGTIKEYTHNQGFFDNHDQTTHYDDNGCEVGERNGKRGLIFNTYSSEYTGKCFRCDGTGIYQPTGKTCRKCGGTGIFCKQK